MHSIPSIDVANIVFAKTEPQKERAQSPKRQFYAKIFDTNLGF